MTHKEYAAGLRLFAKWVEKHPEVPLPGTEIDNYAVDSKDDARNVARGLGSCEKTYGDYNFTLSKMFGPIKARFVFTRTTICKRKVVGVETIPAKFVEAHTEPAQTREIVEWECGSLLDEEEQA